MNRSFFIRIILSLITCLCAFCSFAQDEGRLGPAFIGNWVFNDTGIAVSQEYMLKLSPGETNEWKRSNHEHDKVFFIDTPFVASEKVYEGWTVYISTIVAYLVDGSIETDYTAIFRVYRLEAIGNDSLKLSVSRIYSVGLPQRVMPDKVSKEAKAKFKTGSQSWYSIILRRAN